VLNAGLLTIQQLDQRAPCPILFGSSLRNLWEL